MLEVMQQIALQTASYNIANGVINATSQPPMSIINTSTQPFEPSTSAIRVNVLWFASLIFSLMTASFGMLVKQWLREYLAVDNPSPQARLRIRHFRYPGLMKWKVFEIAAILPLLQQIALALFFLGLCYFTESVHESVGHTSLPLVAAWAFCFSIVTILPMFFPRCPYKTTLLKRLLQSIHMYCANALSKISSYLCDWYWGVPATSMWDYALKWTPKFSRLLDDHANDSNEQIVIRAEHADLDILADVDALQSNDELLGTAILESLHQVQPEWKKVVAFVFQVLRHRLQDPDLTTADKQPQPLDLQGLTQAGRTAVINILSYYSSSAISQCVHSDQAIDQWRNSPETMSAFYIFFSPMRHPLPPSGVEILQVVLQYKGDAVVRLLAEKCPRTTNPDEDNFFLLVLGLSNVLENLDVNLTTSLRYLEIILDVRFKVERAAQIELPNRPFTVQEDMEAWPWHDVISFNAAYYAAEYMILAVLRALRHMKRPAASNTFKALVRSRAPAAVALQPPSSWLVDGFVGLWNISFARDRYYIPALQLKVRAAIEESFTMKESTLALLKACGRLKPHIIIRSQKEWFSAPFGPWLLLEGMWNTCSLNFLELN
jgi:hypothetical protein